jgi:hypothetical protein
MKLVFVLPAVSVAWNEVPTEPVLVGVPLTTPVAVFSERPGGNAEFSAHV